MHNLWLLENIGAVVIGVLVVAAVIVALAVLRIWKGRKNG